MILKKELNEMQTYFITREHFAKIFLDLTGLIIDNLDNEIAQEYKNITIPTNDNFLEEIITDNLFIIDGT